MIIASLSENKSMEKRISITPEIAKKYSSMGFKINITKNYGLHLGFNDEEFKEVGVDIYQNDKEVISNADIIVQLNFPSDEIISLIKPNQTLIGVFNPYENQNKLKEIVNKNVNVFSLELLPRITRAQSMDILSSQANLAGYKAVIEAFWMGADAVEYVSEPTPNNDCLKIGPNASGTNATPKRHPPAPHHLERPEVTIVASG